MRNSEKHKMNLFGTISFYKRFVSNICPPFVFTCSWFKKTKTKQHMHQHAGGRIGSDDRVGLRTFCFPAQQTSGGFLASPPLRVLVLSRSDTSSQWKKILVVTSKSTFLWNPSIQDCPSTNLHSNKMWTVLIAPVSGSFSQSWVKVFIELRFMKYLHV